MSKPQHGRQAKTRGTPKISISGGYLFTFFATLSGVIVGVVASLAMVGPMVRADVASASSDTHKIVSLRPVSDLTTCTGTSSLGITPATGHAAVAAVAPEPVSSDSNGSAHTFVTKLIGGAYNTTAASMTNTGPASHNSISTTNNTTTTVENHNDVTIQSNNNQYTSSGSAFLSNVTNGGSATTGDTSNTYRTTDAVSISN